MMRPPLSAAPSVLEIRPADLHLPPTVPLDVTAVVTAQMARGRDARRRTTER